MRTRTLCLTIGGMLAVLAAPAMRAQTTRMGADIPFAFTVGSKTMEAGRCEARMAGPVVLQIRCDGANAVTFALSNATTAAKPPENSKLVFHRYGDQLFLYRVWFAGDPSGRELPPSQLERRARGAGELASNVIILAKR